MDASVEVGRDAMTAVLKVPAGAGLPPERIHELLAAAGVTVGVQPPAMVAASRAAAVDRTLVIARGEPPQPGLDGWIEPLIQEPTSVYGDGRVDLRESHHFREIHAGDGVLRVIPAQPGQPGRTVTGEDIPAPVVRDADLAACCGPGVVMDPQDPLRAIAERSGIYQRFSMVGKLSLQVLERVEVPGDIDLTIGNIDTHFPVLIRGDIRKGFAVKTTASLEVEGSLEDSRVTAQGTLEVKGGILSGEQRVKAHGDVHARHCQERPIRARNVLLDMGAVGARITARGTVQAREIIGGAVVAAAGVICDALGSPEGVPTSITVGVDPYEANLHAWAVGALPTLEADLAAERERGRCLGHRIQTLLSAGEDHAADDAALRASAARIHQVVMEIARARDVVTHHQERLRLAHALEISATVEVRRQCYAGVLITIGDHQLRIEQPLGRVRFGWSEDGIRILG